jgi:tetratricopeptide (TPR) repeat protein
MRHLARLQDLFQRRKTLLLLLILLTCGAALAGPRLEEAWGHYHWRRAVTAVEKYHSSEAKKHLDVCLKVWPDDVRVHLLAALVARRQGDFKRADQLLWETQRLEKSESKDLKLEWVLLRAAAGDLSPDIEQFLDKTMKNEPEKTALILEAMAEGYLRSYRLRETGIVLERWLQGDPDNTQALFLRGSIWHRVGQGAKSVPDLERAYELDPERDDIRLSLAGGLVEASQFALARDHLKVIHAKYPENEECSILLVRCHTELGEFKEAEHILDQVMADDPQSGMALRARGYLEKKTGRYSEADKWLTRATKVLPFDYRTRFWLYQVLLELGRKKEAEAQKTYMDALSRKLDRLGELTSNKMSVTPNDPAIHYEIGTLFLDLGRLDLGEQWLLSAFHKDANYRPALVALARFYENKGDAQMAEYFRNQAGLEAAPPGAEPRKSSK